MKKYRIQRYIGPAEKVGKTLWEGDTEQELIDAMVKLHKDDWKKIGDKYYWRNKPGSFKGYLDIGEENDGKW